ncbi:MAG: hypothetical protein Q9222_005674 [Ikaeria aurantiellina]
MVFSHGLGGTKNAYSHLLGSLSSHGVIVVAPDHRDGSAPLSLIRQEPGSTPRPVDYRSISHRQSLEVEQARDEQLKIRLWELGLIHEALIKMDRGEHLLNTLAESSAEPLHDLAMFSSTLDVQNPGAIAWAGHSFGAATIVQFVKSVYYHSSTSTISSEQSLFQPSSSSQICHQITPASPVALLDLWCMPLLSHSTRHLNELPLPCYAPGGRSGESLLAILSEAFFKWSSNLLQTKRTMSADPSSKKPVKGSYPQPYIFYPVSSAHLSQSDFGMLFPWLTKKAFKAEDPGRTLRLNTRAILEVMRRNGMEVANTSSVDMEETKEEEGEQIAVTNAHVPAAGKMKIGQDVKILSSDGSVKGWVALDLAGAKGEDEAVNRRTEKTADPMEAVVEGEMGQVKSH